MAVVSVARCTLNSDTPIVGCAAAASCRARARRVAGATAPDAIRIGAGQQTCGADRCAWIDRPVIRAT
jgi:hypothetical protein